MAIFHRLRGLEVTVQVNGWTAVDYDDPAGSQEGQAAQYPRVSSHFIECGDDERFKIHLRVSQNYPWGRAEDALQFTVKIDGVWQTGAVCRRNHNLPHEWEKFLGARVIKDPVDPLQYKFEEFVCSRITESEWPQRYNRAAESNIDDNVTDAAHVALQQLNEFRARFKMLSDQRMHALHRIELPRVAARPSATSSLGG
ncbi:hypothetical protein F5Y17DRAFT_462449 [Xylariaceae sp. FL0594]|nr:hypothetical protein F5Y17DRAFT_462449 [Xylariaceae sp. FL0594]